MALAEIVDLHLDAEPLDALDIRFQNVVLVVEEHGFDEFEGERPGLEGEFAQARHQRLVVQAARRDVDRDFGDAPARARPGAVVAQSALEDGAIDGRHRVDLLGHPHEGVGFEAAHDLVAEVLGVDDLRLQRVGEELPAVPAPALRPVEGDVGVHQEPLGAISGAASTAMPMLTPKRHSWPS